MFAAVSLPAIAARAGLSAALGACGGLCLLASAAVAVFAADRASGPHGCDPGRQPVPGRHAVAHSPG